MLGRMLKRSQSQKALNKAKEGFKSPLFYSSLSFINPAIINPIGPKKKPRAKNHPGFLCLL